MLSRTKKTNCLISWANWAMIDDLCFSISINYGENKQGTRFYIRVRPWYQNKRSFYLPLCHKSSRHVVRFQQLPTIIKKSREIVKTNCQQNERPI